MDYFEGITLNTVTAYPTGQILPEAASTSYPSTLPEVLGAAVEFSRTPYIFALSLILFWIGIRLLKRGYSGYFRGKN